jgi:hypothetical protein
MKTEKPKLRVEAWAIEKVIPYPGNAKEHPPEQIKALAGGIKAYGWDQPIVVDKDGVIIKGHGRRLAAILLKLEQVPVIVRSDLTPDQVKAARLSDNRAVSTTYDTELLKTEIAALALAGNVDISDLGFTDKELEFLNTDIGAIDTGAFVEDVGGAVETQKEGNAEKIAEIDKSGMPIADAFGFKRVTPDLSRRIKAFIGRLEGETGKTGADALAEFLTESGIV